PGYILNWPEIFQFKSGDHRFFPFEYPFSGPVARQPPLLENLPARATRPTTASAAGPLATPIANLPAESWDSYPSAWFAAGRTEKPAWSQNAPARFRPARSPARATFRNPAPEASRA